MKKFFNTKQIILIIILLLAGFFRLWNLGSVPPSASMDEASIGYNAYSILKTGVDEYGTRFPLLLRAYDDFRPALYVYLVIPFVKLFGLDIFAVRLPSVILSILTVITSYLLVKELLKQTRTNNDHLPLLISFLLAISPWHIYISRLGHEVNAGFAFFFIGLLFFFKNKVFLWILFFTLSFISYQTEKIFIPTMIIGMTVIFWKDKNNIRKRMIIYLIAAFIILIPFLNVTLKPDSLIRFQGTSIFNLDSSWQRNEQRKQLLAQAIKDNNLIEKKLHGEKFFKVKLFTEGYLSHFNSRWLFANFGSDPHKVPNLGLLYLWEAPFIFIGIVALLLQKDNLQRKIFIFYWFFSAPLASAITTDAPHALRSYTFLPIWQLFSGLGILWLYKRINKQTWFCILFFVFGIVSTIYFFNHYFYTFPKTQSGSFQYALSQAIPFVLKNENHYTKVVFSNTDALYQSYMFYLFYSKYDPFIYQDQGGTKSGGYAKTHSFGKYEFRPINWKEDQKKKDTLYIGNIADFPIEVPSTNFVYKNGQVGVRVMKNQ